MTRILVDTNIWIDHFRVGVPLLAQCLQTRDVVLHAAILGELALGGLSLQKRRLFAWLPRLPTVEDSDALAFVEKHGVQGRGVGWVDCHLLATTAEQPACRLWTRDKKLLQCAQRLGLAWRP